MTNKRPLSYLGINEVNPPDMTLANRAPTTSDLNYDLGDMWINKTTSITYQLVSKAAGSATWTIITPGASDVDTINALAPAGGNIVIAGGTNLTDVNGGNTVTLNLDDAISLATSVTSPIYTSVAGMSIDAPVGNDITIKMGDAAGANKVSFVDSATVEVFAVDSNGALSSSTGLTVAGNFAQTAGTFDVGQDNAADAISIGGGTTARTINIGDSAAPHVLTLGSVDTTAETIVQAGTVGLSETSTGPMTLDSAGVLELNSSAGIISVGNDAVNQNANFGTAGVRTVTVGSATGASSTVVQSGTGAASFAANATDHTTTIGSTTGVSSTVIQGGTGGITFTGDITELNASIIGTTGIYIPAFTMNSMVNTAANTGGVATGATGDVNNVMLQTGVNMNAFVVGAGQTILQPVMGANGLIVSGDQTNTEGMEYNFPYQQYTIGTSAPFMFELGLYINDMDGADPYVFGFRKVEANNALMTNYTDYATIGMIAGTSVTEIITSTELNSGGNTITNTTDLWGGDGTTNTLAVLVDAAGNVTYTINGVAPTNSAAFQFDNGDVVIPFIRIVHSASPTTVAITRKKIGYQA